MLQESIFVPLTISSGLHMKHFQGDPEGIVVFLLHGAIENGRIFYSETKQKGLAWFLAEQGFDVYVPDLAGRGHSYPPLNKLSQHGQTESICIEIPTLLDYVHSKRPHAPQIWMAHSWGGVLLSSVLARFPKYLNALKSLVFFGTKRSVYGVTPEKTLKIHFFWNRFAFLISKYYGYLPAQQLGIGSDNESKKSHIQSVSWIQAGPWIDTDDGFNYGQAIKNLNLPPQLHLAGRNDFSLGHPQDVERFRRELKGLQSDYWLLGHEMGFKHNYGHIDMLTHADTPEDIFKPVQNWLKKHLS